MGPVLPHPPLREQPRLLRQLFNGPQPVLDELSERFGPVVGLGAGPVRMAIVGGPTELRQLFGTSTESFRWGHKFNVLGFVVGDGSMIVSDGAEHKRRRSSVQKAFSRRRLDAWVPGIVSQTDDAMRALVAEIDQGRSVRRDLYPIGRRLVLGIVVRALFGERLGARCDEIGDLFQRPQDYLESPAIRQMPHPFPGTARARVRADRRALDALIDEEIALLRSEGSTDVESPTGAVLAALVADATLDDAEIRDQVVTLMGAGYDTTSASLAWMLWRCALHPEIWRSLRHEADAILGPTDQGSPVDASVLPRLDLAARVMRETLRLHPAGVISPREAAVDVEVGGYTIRKGTLILWSAHLAGRDPSAWAAPEVFDPDRFVDPDPDQKALADIAWVPFGRGARNCIGFALAQMELTLIIARMAQHLDLDTTATSVPGPVGMVVNRPEGGVPLEVSPRT